MSSRVLLVGEKSGVPRLRRIELEALAPFAECGDGWIEDSCAGLDFSLGAQCGKSLTVDRLNRAAAITVEDETARYQACSELWLDRPE